MLKVKLPTGREVMTCWSNIAPCGMISEKLVELSGIEKLPLKNSKRYMCQSVLGGAFGGGGEQWYYVRELEVTLKVKKMDGSPYENSDGRCSLVVGPLLVAPSPVTPLVFGADFQRAVNGDVHMGQGGWAFPGLGVKTKMYPLDGFAGPDPDNPEPLFHGSCSWMWSPEVEHETCAKCAFCFPNLMKCAGCRQVTYCSRICQKRHWKKHRQRCAAASGPASGGPGS